MEVHTWHASIKQSDIIGGVGVAGYLLILLWAWFGLPGV